MTTYRFPTSTNTAITLGATENIYVAEGVVVGTTITAIYGTGLKQVVEVFGTVVSAADTIVLGSTAGGNGVSVKVGERGHIVSIYADGSGASALVLNGGGNTVVNDGEIRSPGYGVFILPSSVTVANTIINNGTITAASGVDSRGSAGSALHLINTGTIDGSEKSYGELASQNQATSTNETITNSGLMKGDILLNSGDDSYDGRLGTVKGTVFGGDGADTVLGGAENNVIDGGAGIDNLFGGKGADILTGGLDADTFTFKLIAETTVASKGRDTITDFQPAEGDRIDLHFIDAKSTKNGNQVFHFIEGDAFGHAAGELRFKQSGGDTYVFGDVNGDAKSDFAIKLDGLVTLAATDFIL